MKSQMQRGKATRATSFKNIYLLIMIIAMAAAVRQPVFASSGAAVEAEHKAAAAHGEAHEGEHACPEGARCLHPHAHEIPELPNLVDGVRAYLGKVLVTSDGTLETGPGGEIILNDDKVDFIESGVGEKIYPESPLENRAEDMLYSVWIQDGPHKGRLVVVQVEKHRLVLQAGHGGKAAKAEGHGEEKEGPAEVHYKVKEEATMTSRFIGTGINGLNWTDIANIIFEIITVICLIIFGFLGTRKLKKIPSGFQAFIELIVTGLDTFTRGMIGPDSRKYLPFLGTIFLYILFMALMGLLPFIKSPIAMNLNIPLSIAICVFLFVQYHGIRQNGVGGYVKHLMGEPIWLAPLQMPLHVLGEFIKPVSLSLRLFANISAEDILVAALVIMAVGFPLWLPLPLQVLFFPLALMFSGIQALVFTSLSAIYISQMSAHHEHHDEEGHHN